MNDDYVVDELDSGFNPITSSLLRPRDTIRYVLGRDIKLYYGMLIYLYGLTMSMDNMARRDYELSPIIIVMLFLLAPVSGIITVYIYGWIMSLFGKVFGGVASNAELRASILWSSIPLMIIIPITFITFLVGATNTKHIVHSNLIVTIIYWILLLIELVVAIWCFVNLVSMVSEVQKFSAVKAFFSIILPAVILIFAILFIMFFLFFTTKNPTNAFIFSTLC